MRCSRTAASSPHTVTRLETDLKSNSLSKGERQKVVEMFTFFVSIAAKVDSHWFSGVPVVHSSLQRIANRLHFDAMQNAFGTKQTSESSLP